MKKSASVALLFGLATLTLLPVEAQAACRQGFCVSGRDDPDTGNHVVDFTVSISNYSHFNYAGPDGVQHELGANQREFTFRNLPSGKVESYSIQACHKNLLSSSCTPWAVFTHTAP